VIEYPKRRYKGKKDPSFDPDKWEFNIARRSIAKELMKVDPALFRKKKELYNLVLVGICVRQNNTWIMSVRVYSPKK
jgi:hypothetical protein